MKKVLSLVALAMISTIMFAVNDGVKADQNKKEAKSGEVIVMNKEMFINDVFDYQNSKEWKYKGDKPAIIDLYADWCGPCRMTAPIMKSLAKEYDGKIFILYYGEELDEEGLPELTDKEVDAIACYIAMTVYYKKGLQTGNQLITQQALDLKREWSKLCDAARIAEHISQNEMNEILDAKTSWNRKVYGKSLKPLV